MSNEVSNQETRTLLQCVQQGIIPQPRLMRWNEWQVWRSAQGRRPHTVPDGYATQNAEESALYKSMMKEFYGENWPAVSYTHLTLPTKA